MFCYDAVFQFGSGDLKRGEVGKAEKCRKDEEVKVFTPAVMRL